MSHRVIRAVVVHRPTEYELLLAAHGTRGQAEFFLASRGRQLAEIEHDHAQASQAIERVLGAIPAQWRRTRVARDELNRFLFEPDDVVLAVGQDGLVANVAKYLTGQLVVGVNPLPQKIDGVLVRHEAAGVSSVLGAIDRARDLRVEERTMVEAKLDDGQTLVALNEVFVGHCSHQSARYRIGLDAQSERQSSSGLICCTGTGASGWASSINRTSAQPLELPSPTAAAVCFFVREAWASRDSAVSITTGRLDKSRCLTVVSEMNRGGVVFGDGIEDDFLDFGWGRQLSVGVSPLRLRLVT